MFLGQSGYLLAGTMCKCTRTMVQALITIGTIGKMFRLNYGSIYLCKNLSVPEIDPSAGGTISYRQGRVHSPPNYLPYFRNSDEIFIG